MSIILNPSVGLKGYFKLEVFRPDGRRRLLVDWFPNLITNFGLNAMGANNYLSYCHVGTNNTPPTVLDTKLAGFLASTSTTQWAASGAQTSPPYYGWYRKAFRFGQGAAAGNLAEVGVAFYWGENDGLFSRALILDATGNPTTITVLSDEVLDVSYECRLYPDLEDKTGTITITGSGEHTYVARPANVTDSYWYGYLGSPAAAANYMGIYTGPIGSITGYPSGSSSSAYMWTAGYVGNSLERVMGAGWNLNDGNIGNIRSFHFGTTLGGFQCEITPTVHKDGTKVFDFQTKVSWGRYTPP